MTEYNIRPIAKIHNPFKDKFGIPRQSNLADGIMSTIIFEESYRDDNSLRGLEEYSHIWLLWIFNEADSKKDWSPTVRPPRLGGNKRMGVFSTRSPFHPNKIGLSCVKISSIEKTKEFGTVINVLGADLMDGTPIIDIKPYLSFTDSHPDAKCGFAENVFDYELDVTIPKEIEQEMDDNTRTAITAILKQDPRPPYHNDPDRIYAICYDDFEIKFKVLDKTLTVTSFDKKNGSEK